MRIADRWLSILSLFGIAYGGLSKAFDYFLKALDWGGRADFAYSHSGEVATAIIFARSLLDLPTWLTGPVFFACIGLFVWDIQRARARPYQDARGSLRVDPYLAIAFVAALVFVGALVAYVVRRQAGPIEWNFDLVGSPIAAVYSDNEPLRITSFQINGKNISGRAIEPLESYARSDTSYKIENLGVVKSGNIIPLNKAVIGPDSVFYLAYSFPPNDPLQAAGLSIEQFRAQYGAFTFYFRSKTMNTKDRSVKKKLITS